MSNIGIGIDESKYEYSKKRISYDSILTFDGVDDFVTTGVSPRDIVNANGDFSVQFTVRLDNLKSGQMPLSANAGGQRFYFITRGSGAFGIGFLNWRNDYTDFYQAGEEMVLAVTVSNGVGKFFKNGELIDQFSGVTGTHDATNIYLGRSSASGYEAKCDLRDVIFWSRGLSDSEVKENYRYEVRDNDSGIFAKWRLDEGAGDIVVDKTSNKRIGNLYGATWKIKVKKQNMIAFDGVDDYIDVGSSVIRERDFTVGALVIPRKSNSYIISQYAGGASGRFWVGINSVGNFGWRIGEKSRTVNIELDKLAYLYVTRERDICKIYIDGILVGEDTATEDILRSDTLIGAYGVGFGHFDGHMINVGVWNRALSESEIQKVMLDGEEEITNEALALWKFNESIGDVARDSSGNGYHGVIHGANWLTKKHTNSHLFFDGVDDMVHIRAKGYHDNFTISADFHIGKGGAVGGSGGIVTLQTPYSLLIQPTGSTSLRVRYWTHSDGPSGYGAGYDMLVNYGGLEGQDNNITVTHDGSGINVYINGELVRRDDTNVRLSISSNLYLGYYSGGNSYGSNFKGKIYRVAHWSRALSQDEIRDFVYDGEKVIEGNLEGLWVLNRGIGGIAVDSSNNSRDGAIIGADWRKERESL